jgi:alpha-beta hydrolase superfamily lysophospholipase
MSRRIPSHTPRRGAALTLRNVLRAPDEGAAERVELETERGTIRCRWHPAAEGETAVLWVFGAGGGLGGPAGGLYPRLAAQLAPRGVASLELDYRHPNDLAECVLDVLLGVEHLASLGRERVVLVGHSFGGAVVISAGAASARVRAVAALSSQSYGTDLAAALAPRPLLVMHGLSDEVLPAACSRDIYLRAKEPKRMELYAGCRHGLDDCRDAIDRDLLGWIVEVAR